MIFFIITITVPIVKDPPVKKRLPSNWEFNSEDDMVIDDGSVFKNNIFNSNVKETVMFASTISQR